MMVIDAKDLVLGRLASVAAKKALEGEQIEIVNCELAVVTGTKQDVIGHFKSKRAKGSRAKGPYYPRYPDRIVRRTIRGMLPYKRPRGADAFRKVRCHIGIPEALKSEKLQTIQEANVSKAGHHLYGRLGTIAKDLGARL